MAGIFPFLCFCAIIFASESQIVDNAASAIEYENVLTQNGYHFRYRIEDSARIENENGVFDHTRGENGVLVVSGSYNFVGPDRQTYQVDFVADENGYRPMVKSRMG